MCTTTCFASYRTDNGHGQQLGQAANARAGPCTVPTPGMVNNGDKPPIHGLAHSRCEVCAHVFGTSLRHTTPDMLKPEVGLDGHVPVGCTSLAEQIRSGTPRRRPCMPAPFDKTESFAPGRHSTTGSMNREIPLDALGLSLRPPLLYFPVPQTPQLRNPPHFPCPSPQAISRPTALPRPTPDTTPTIPLPPLPCWDLMPNASVKSCSSARVNHHISSNEYCTYKTRHDKKGIILLEGAAIMLDAACITNG
jgi:hypothetical protein